MLQADKIKVFELFLIPILLKNHNCLRFSRIHQEIYSAQHKKQTVSVFFLHIFLQFLQAPSGFFERKFKEKSACNKKEGNGKPENAVIDIPAGSSKYDFDMGMNCNNAEHEKKFHNINKAVIFGFHLFFLLCRKGAKTLLYKLLKLKLFQS